ncbi:response regulator [Paenibacillus sp. GCM10027626]|uniref:response regulator n=1 Tax=Paenibacillus sp. GCM10027626 TaxID=3273411 RepID=UPI00362E5963
MYKALIVDDEPRILKGLHNIIQWEDYGIEIAGQAGNGAEALRMIEGSRISILITDIHMPEMDGLELIRQLKRRGLSVRTIILSGYSDFTYVKEAALLGIENYLLKPIVRDELSSTLLNIIEKIEHETNQQIHLRNASLILKNNILYRWLMGNISHVQLKERADLLQIDLNSQHYVVGLIKLIFEEDHEPVYKNLMNFACENICNELLTARTNVITLNDPNGLIVVIFYGDDACCTDQSVHDMLQECISAAGKFLKRDVFVTVGSHESDSEHVHQSYSNARQLMEYSLIIPPNSIVCYDQITGEPNVKNEKTKIEFDAFQTSLSLKDKEQAAAFIDDTFRMVGQMKGIPPLYVQNLSIEMLYRILSALNQLRIETATLLDGQDNMFIHLLKVKHLDEMRDWLKSIALKAIEKICSEEDSMNPLVKRVLDYLESNYSDNISLKTIAASFHVNAAYLGQLIIKEKNETFSNLLNMKRIEAAKELLRHTSLGLNEIATQVGYVNQSYFNALFKKITGAYPTRYRLESKEVL